MTISRDVVAAMDELGFGLSPKPTYVIPEIPRDITELDDDGLMDLFVQFTQWNDHLAGAMAIAIVNETEAKSALAHAEAKAMLNAWTGAKGETATKAKAVVAASDEIHELTKDYDYKYAFRKLLETKTGNVERNAQLVSRELTRRTSGGSGLQARSRRFTT